MAFIVGFFVGYVVCILSYKTAIDRWNYDCSPTRNEDWKKETHPHD